MSALSIENAIKRVESVISYSFKSFLCAEQHLLFDPLGQTSDILFHPAVTSDRCTYYASALKHLLHKDPNLKIISDTYVPADNEGNPRETHVYICIRRPGNASPENDIIIDPTISQFLPNYRDVFIGTRSHLKELIEQADRIIGCPGDQRSAFFEMNWGTQSHRQPHYPEQINLIIKLDKAYDIHPPPTIKEM